MIRYRYTFEISGLPEHIAEMFPKFITVIAISKSRAIDKVHEMAYNPYRMLTPEQADPYRGDFKSWDADISALDLELKCIEEVQEKGRTKWKKPRR